MSYSCLFCTGGLWSHVGIPELTGEHNSHANHIFSVDQVENFDKLNIPRDLRDFFKYGNFDRKRYYNFIPSQALI